MNWTQACLGLEFNLKTLHMPPARPQLYSQSSSLD